MKKGFKRIFFDELSNQKFLTENYQKEIRSELNDHFEDLKHDLILSGYSQKDAEKEAVRRLGEPKKIINTLNYYMKDSKFYIWFETFIFSIAAWPFYWILFMANADWLFQFNGADDVFTYDDLYRAFIGTIIALLPIVFFVKHLSSKWVHNLVIRKELFINILSYLIPILIFHIFLYANFVGHEMYLGNYYQKEILHILVILFLNLGLIKFWYRRIDLNKLLKKKESTAFKYLKTILGISLCLYLFLSLISNFIGVLSFLNGLFLPKLAFDFLQRFVLLIVFGDSAGILAFWLLGFVYFGVLIIVLRNLYKYHRSKDKKNFPYFSLAGVFYISSVLFIVPSMSQRIQWHVPVNHLSETIEKRQMLMFYPMSQYMNAAEGRLFHYNISYSNDAFNLNQSGSAYLFEISDIKSINNYEMRKYKKPYPGDIFPNDISIEMNKNFKCISYPQNPSKDQIVIEGENQWLCNELWYKDKLIYIQKQEWPYPILEIEVDKEEKFMLINLSNGAYDPTDVYLLAL